MTRFPRTAKTLIPAPPVPPRPGDAVTGFDVVRELAAGLPGVTESTSYGTPALKVAGKTFCRMWGQREYDRDDGHDTEVIVVFCALDEKPVCSGPAVAPSSPRRTTTATARCSSGSPRSTATICATTSKRATS